MKYGEGNNKPHALTSMAGTLPAYTPTVDLSVTYTDFKKIATLKEGLNEYAVFIQRRRRLRVHGH